MKRLIFLGIMIMAGAQTSPRVVDVSAKRFEFTPNVIHLKKGEPVTIRLTSTDKTHGLLIDALNVDLDASEGTPDEVTITPAQAGTFAAICDHFCGSGHGGMKLTVVVE